MNSRPILWHIEISHYNKKARWAFELEGVGYKRRAPVPGYHDMALALALTRGRCYSLADPRARRPTHRLEEMFHRHRRRAPGALATPTFAVPSS
jgi:hypothetical protein